MIIWNNTFIRNDLFSTNSTVNKGSLENFIRWSICLFLFVCSIHFLFFFVIDARAIIFFFCILVFMYALFFSTHLRNTCPERHDLCKT